MITSQSPNTRQHLMAGFSKVDVDLHFLIDAFAEVLRELGRDDLAAALPWKDEVQSLASCPDGVEQAYSLAFGLLNMVEESAAASVRRVREGAQGPLAERGLWGHELARLKQSGFSSQEIAQALSHTRVEPVLTAHPTEAKRLPVLEAYRGLYSLLVRRDDPNLSRSEAEQLRDEIKAALERLWRTGEISLAKPGIEAERRNVMYYLSDVFPSALPRLDARLRSAWQAAGLDESALSDTCLPQLRFGTWVGGDRDGHPGVTTEVTAQTLGELRRGALHVCRRLLTDLVGRVSLSGTEQTPPQELSQATSRLIEEGGEAAIVAVSRHSEEPWRAFVELLITKLPPEGEAVPPAGRYARPSQLLDDLALLRRSLEAVGAHRLARTDVFPVVRALEAFGFHLAALDIRQNSSFHDAALSQLMCACGMDAADYASWPEGDRLRVLNDELRSPRPFLVSGASAGPEADAVLSVYRLVARHMDAWGPDGVGSLIVSMTRQLSDLLGVYVLAREAGLCSRTPEGLVCALPVVPLFETLDDLQRAPDILRAFLDHPMTRRSFELDAASTTPTSNHKTPTSPLQQVMIGYSDSNKDAGIWASQWGLQNGQAQMAQMAKEVGVELRFFHGRGGTISRGAGPTHRFLEALPHGSLSGDIRLTEQGETIAQKYAHIPTATYNLEVLLAGVAGATLQGKDEGHAMNDAGQDDSSSFRNIADFLAARSHRAYREVLAAEGFMKFFRAATPIDVLEQSRIGSRPSRRTGATTLDDLRAIPWVFAWNQSRFYLPGWYGIGTALSELASEQPEEFARLQTGISAWEFGSYVLTNVETNLSSADVELMRAYAGLVKDETLREAFMTRILDEYARAGTMLDAVFGRPLEERRPRMLKTLHLRAQALRALHDEQISLLRTWREAQTDDPDRANTLLPPLLLSVNAIAGGLRTTG